MMARKKKIDHQELMIETEKLLLETGYDSFHFRLLAERLGVGRSTLYEYYANKDDLITAYVHSFAYERVEESKLVLEIHDLQDQIEAFLRVFLKYNHIQQIIIMVTQMEGQKKPQNEESIIRIKKLIKDINAISLQIIQKGKKEGKIRQELDDMFISYMMFNLIQIPNFRQQSDKERLKLFVDFLLNGVST